jgi:hypothetical protein
MESFVKIRNVGRAEEIFRYVLGIILLILGFFISGSLRWVLGGIGLALVLTGIFGY